jgi:hypothetical protein
MYDRDKPQFVCSYRGAADYSYKGRQYVVRSFAVPGPGPTPTSADGHYNGDYYFTGILPSVGTIQVDHYPHEFPPDEVCAFFPDCVPARWNADFTALEYRGERPETVTTKWGHVWGRKCAERHCADYAPDRAADYGLLVSRAGLTVAG